MSISQDEAAKALDEVGRTQRRTAVLRGYERGAPHFWLWGVIWMLGYAISDYRPDLANWAWLVLDVAGWTGSVVLAHQQRAAAQRTTARASGWQLFGAVALMLGFLYSTYYILPPSSGRQYGALPALMMALLYSLVGLWAGVRWLAIGLALFALTLTGYAVVTNHFLLWMAFAGGGALILTGLWMKRP